MADCRCIATVEFTADSGTVTSMAVAGSIVFAGLDSGNVVACSRNLSHHGDVGCRRTPPVKAVAVAGNRVYTAHSDHKIRVWSAQQLHGKLRFSKMATLPTAADVLRNAAKFWKTDNYVQTRRHRHRLWLRHFDTVTAVAVCSADTAETEQRPRLLLYSASWDRTVKVWRLADMTCAESIAAHDDAVTGVRCAERSSTVYTASADGSVKIWRRRIVGGRGTVSHRLAATLRCFGGAAVNCVELGDGESGVYCGTSAGNVEWCVGAARKSSLRGHGRAVLSVSAVGCFVCSGSADGSVAVWRRRSSGHEHEQVHRFRAHGGPVRCVFGTDAECGDGGFCCWSPAAFWSSVRSSSRSCSRSCSPPRRRRNAAAGAEKERETESETEHEKEQQQQEKPGFRLYSGGADHVLKLWWVPASHLAED